MSNGGGVSKAGDSVDTGPRSDFGVFDFDVRDARRICGKFAALDDQDQPRMKLLHPACAARSDI